MGKRGQNRHMKRIAVPSAVGIRNKKEHTWISKPMAGPHEGKHSMALAILLRDILNVSKTNKETKKILNSRTVYVDGKIRTKEKFPVGLMDVVSLETENRHYRLMVESHGRLIPVEIEKNDVKEKIGKVVRKFTYRKGEIRITLHDGRTMKADNNVKVGDSVIISIPENKIKAVLKMEKGSLCLIKGGKHAGTVAKIENIKKEGVREAEAKMKAGKEEFITVLKHLCVIDDRIKGAA